MSFALLPKTTISLDKYMRQLFADPEQQAVLDCNFGEKQTHGMNPIISLAASSSSFLTACTSVGHTGRSHYAVLSRCGWRSQAGEVSLFCGTEQQAIESFLKKGSG